MRSLRPVLVAAARSPGRASTLSPALSITGLLFSPQPRCRVTAASCGPHRKRVSQVHHQAGAPAGRSARSADLDRRVEPVSQRGIVTAMLAWNQQPSHSSVEQFVDRLQRNPARPLRLGSAFADRGTSCSSRLMRWAGLSAFVLITPTGAFKGWSMRSLRQEWLRLKGSRISIYRRRGAQALLCPPEETRRAVFPRQDESRCRVSAVSSVSATGCRSEGWRASQPVSRNHG